MGERTAGVNAKRLPSEPLVPCTRVDDQCALSSAPQDRCTSLSGVKRMLAGAASTDKELYEVQGGWASRDAWVVCPLS